MGPFIKYMDFIEHGLSTGVSTQTKNLKESMSLGISYEHAIRTTLAIEGTKRSICAFILALHTTYGDEEKYSPPPVSVIPSSPSL